MPCTGPTRHAAVTAVTPVLSCGATYLLPYGYHTDSLMRESLASCGAGAGLGSNLGSVYMARDISGSERSAVEPVHKFTCYQQYSSDNYRPLDRWPWLCMAAPIYLWMRIPSWQLLKGSISGCIYVIWKGANRGRRLHPRLSCACDL